MKTETIVITDEEEAKSYINSFTEWNKCKFNKVGVLVEYYFNRDNAESLTIEYSYDGYVFLGAELTLETN